MNRLGRFPCRRRREETLINFAGSTTTSSEELIRVSLRRLLQWIGLVFVLVQPARAQGQALYLRRYQEPVLFPMPTISQMSVGGYAEGIYDQSSFQNSSTSVSHVHVFAGPTIGLSLAGSIYHPNFLTYALNLDGAAIPASEQPWV